MLDLPPLPPGSPRDQWPALPPSSFVRVGIALPSSPDADVVQVVGIALDAFPGLAITPTVNEHPGEWRVTHCESGYTISETRFDDPVEAAWLVAKAGGLVANRDTGEVFDWTRSMAETVADYNRVAGGIPPELLS